MSINPKLEEEINALKELFNKLTNVLVDVSNELNKVHTAVEHASEQESGQIKALQDKIASLESKLSAVLSIVEEKKEEKLTVSPQPEEPVALTSAKEETVELTEVEAAPEGPSEVAAETKPEIVPAAETKPEIVPAAETKPEIVPAAEESQIRSEITKLTEELATVERNLSDLEFNYEGGFIDEAEYTEKVAQLQRKRDELKSKIQELQSKIP